MVARFDDLRPGRTASFGFTEEDLVRIVSADSLEEVTDALRQVEAGVRSGLWAAGMVSYDAAPAFDDAMQIPGPPIDGLPLVWFGLFRRRIADLQFPERGSGRLGPFHATETPDGHGRAISHIRDRIVAGDVYQVNHTMRLLADVEGDTGSLYRDLIEAQAAEYNAHIRMGRFEILSASPELFFSVSDGRIVTRPMKGTAPRGRWPADDERMRSELQASEKERAENIMIVDLLRNDLGRIARFGSVRVDALLEAERYPTVWQLTSTISAVPRPEVDIADVFAALFPCGSVTGAPKISATGIIAEQESGARGAYCGAIGYLAPPGEEPSARFSVAIRTLLVEVETGQATYGTGGGITFDSTRHGEYAEALLKAEILTERRPEFELLETLRWEPGEGFLFLDEHLTRLAASARYFDRPCDTREVAAALGAAVVGATGPQMVRCLIDRGGGVSVELVGAPEAGAPVRLAVDTEPVDPGSPFLYHKTTNRSLYEDARARHPEAEDVLLINDRGEVTETSIANVAVRFGERWFTPPLESGCLPGVYRAVLLAEGRIEERAIPVVDLMHADELAVLNSVRLWRPASLQSPAGV